MKLIPIAIFALASCATVCPVDTTEVRVYPLQYVMADGVARILADVEKTSAGSEVKIAADSRQNSLVVRGAPADLVRVERRIRELDVR